MGIFARPPPASKLMTIWVGGAFGQPNNVSWGSPRNPRQVRAGQLSRPSFGRRAPSRRHLSSTERLYSASRAARRASSRNRWAPLMRPQFPKGAVDGLDAQVLATPSLLRRISPSSFFQFQGLAALRAAAMRCLGRAGFFFFYYVLVGFLVFVRSTSDSSSSPSSSASLRFFSFNSSYGSIIYKRLMQVLPLLFLGPLLLAPRPAAACTALLTSLGPRLDLQPHTGEQVLAVHTCSLSFSSTRRTPPVACHDSRRRVEHRC